MIDENLLLDFGAKKASYSKGDQLFREGDTAIITTRSYLVTSR